MTRATRGDNACVVGREPVVDGETAGPFDAADTAAGPFAVMRDQEDGGPGHHRRQLDERLDTPSGPDEFLQVRNGRALLDGVVRRLGPLGTLSREPTHGAHYGHRFPG